MNKMILAIVIALVFASVGCAASIYTITINDTDIQTVEDAAIEIMTGKNFTIDEITPYKAVFFKGFGDGFWIESSLCYVNMAFVERDGNVKMLVSEIEKIGAITKKRGVDHLIPLIKQIKSAVDGTPEELINNEAVDQLPGSGNEREKVLGLVLDDEVIGEGVRIMSIDPGSLAEESGVLALDVLIEVNGRETLGMTPSSVMTYLANKMAAKSSIILIVSRGSEKKLFSINPGK